MDGAPPQDPAGGAPPPPPPAAPPPATSGSPARGHVSEQRNLWIVLSYLGLLALIPLLVEKEDSEVQWHAKNGLVLTGAEFVAFIGLWIVIAVVGAISGGLGCILGLIWPLAMLAVLVLHIMCIVKGLKGERLIVPVVSELAGKF